MANFIVPNAEYLSIDTTSASDSTTLSEVIGKKYIITNVGTGGNTLTVNYGTSSKVLADGEAFIVLYDGTIWVVLNDKNYQGDSIETTDILIPVNGKIDSQNNRSVQKKVSWNPWEAWKESSVTGDLRFNRGEAGVFGEYENLWQSPVLTSVTLTNVGDWEKIEQFGGAQGEARVTLSTAQSKTSSAFILKKGNSDVVQILLSMGGVIQSFKFVFSTGSITGVTGTFDTLTVKEIVQHQEYLIEFTKVVTPSGTDYLRIFPSQSVTVGHYTYFKDISYVGGIDYPVPYVKGTHTADSWVHPINWNESADWTIDIWFKIDALDPTATYILDTRAIVGDTNFLILRYSGSNLAILAGDGSTTTQNFSVAPTLGEYNNIKLVVELGSQFRAYLTSSLVATITTNVPTTLAPIIMFGNNIDKTAWMNGDYSDIMIRPTADVTTTHYTLGLPWTNPENTINAEHGAYVDKYGNYVGETFTGMEEDVYSIVEQYTIDDQTVTKWSNGDMEIRGVVSLVSIAITATSGALFRNVATQTISFLDDFIFLPKIILEVSQNTSANIVCSRSTGSSVSSTNLYIFSTTSQASVTVFVDYVIKGTWK